jgi:hypothetical protein
MTKSLDELGMKQPMTRRDFIGGVATCVTLLAAGATDAAEPAVSVANPADQYPPLRSTRRSERCRNAC